MSLQEIDEASQIINSAADEDANIIFGTVIDESMGDQIRVTVIATGFDGTEQQASMDFNAKPSVSQSFAASAAEDSLTPAFDDGIPDFLKRSRY